MGAERMGRPRGSRGREPPRSPGGGAKAAPKTTPAAAGRRHWSLASAVHKQAAACVARMLAAAESRSRGVSLKSLTLAPHIVAKKATHAVTYETLKRESDPSPCKHSRLLASGHLFAAAKRRKL